LVIGEEPDVLRLGDDLAFFNSKESRLRGESELSLKARGDLHLLCLWCGNVGFSFVATDFPDRLCCSGDADFDSGEPARLIGDKEFSFVDD